MSVAVASLFWCFADEFRFDVTDNGTQPPPDSWNVAEDFSDSISSRKTLFIVLLKPFAEAEHVTSITFDFKCHFHNHSDLGKGETRDIQGKEEKLFKHVSALFWKKIPLLLGKYISALLCMRIAIDRHHY